MNPIILQKENDSRDLSDATSVRDVLLPCIAK